MKAANLKFREIWNPIKIEKLFIVHIYISFYLDNSCEAKKSH